MSIVRTGGMETATPATPADVVKRKKTDMSTKTITTAELFRDLREIVILHAGSEYRLRITSNGKLILTK